MTAQALHIDDVALPRPRPNGHPWRWSSLSPQEAAVLYAEQGWPVVMQRGLPHLPVSQQFGYAAVQAAAEAVNALPDLRESRRMSAGDEQIVLLRFDAHALRRTTVPMNLWLTGVENPSAPKRRVVLDFHVYGEGDLVPLPYGGSRWTWLDTSETWFSQMPREFSQAARVTPLVASSLDAASAEPATEDAIVRPGCLGLLFGQSGEDITTLLLAASVKAADQGGMITYFDYAGIGPGTIRQHLGRHGLTELSRFTYIQSPPAWGPHLDLRGVIEPRTRVIVINDLPGLFYAAGRTGRSGEHVLPVLDDLRRIASEFGVGVLVSDRSKGRVPAGARVKLDRVDHAWLVRPVLEATADRDGLLQLEGVKNATDQLAAVLTSGSVEFGADGGLALAAEEQLRQRVRADLLETVRQRPRRLTRHELTNLADLAGSRDLRRQVVIDLETEGLLITIKEPRPERGATRTRAVYMVNDQ